MNAASMTWEIIKEYIGLPADAQVVPFGVEAFSKFGDCINEVLGFLADGAINAFGFLLNFSLEFFISIAIIDIGLSFVFSNFQFSVPNVLHKVLKYGFCLFAITNWKMILNDFFLSITTGVGQAMTGTSVSGLTENLSQPQMLMRMALDNLPGLNIIANTSAFHLFTNALYSLGIFFMSWFVILVYMFLAIKIAYVYVQFYVSAAFNIWGLPFSVNGFTKFIPEGLLGSLWASTVTLMMTSVMIYFTTIGIKEFLPSLPADINNISEASRAGFFIPYMKYCLMLVVFAYLTGDIPKTVANHLSGAWEL